MTENVPVHCPACEREHAYTPPAYPCPCGAPVRPLLVPHATPTEVRRRTWADSWVSVRCEACGRQEDWPHPELGCDCGALLRLPVADGAGSDPSPGPAEDPAAGAGYEGHPATRSPRRRTAHGGGRSAARSRPGGPTDPSWPPEDCGRSGEPGPPAPAGSATGEAGAAPRPEPSPESRPADPPDTRPEFRPMTIRTARDVVLAAGHFLRWLGFTDVRAADARPASGVDLRGTGVVALVDPTTAHSGLRAIETLWLNGLNESSAPVCFALAGFTGEARARADALALPLFVLDLTGTPQPVNPAADTLLRTGA